MNRRNRTLIVVGLAVLLATLASYGVYRAIQQIPVVEVPIASYHVVVAKEGLPVGTLLNDQQVALVPWPADSPIEGGYSKIEEVVGRGLMTTVSKNEPLTATKLAPIEAGAGLPVLVTTGMRAMSVRVNDVIGVAGHVVAGTRVDLIVITRAGQEAVSRTVVSNVEVLAAGINTDREAARSGAAQATAVVTLLVTPEDGEKIALAQTQGQIMLALRNPMDVAPVETRGVRMSGLLASPNPEPVRVNQGGRVRVITPPPPPPPPPPYTVETIRGNSRTQEVVK